MDWIVGMQRAIDYIEAHLTEPIDYEAVAAQSFSSFFRGFFMEKSRGILTKGRFFATIMTDYLPIRTEGTNERDLII